MFDSGATHDFISRACTQKHQLDIQHSDSPYMISTPGGRMATKHLVRKTPLGLGGKVFNVCLIVLDGQGINVILVMGWIKRHKMLLDTAIRVVHLDSPVHGSTAIQLSLPSVVPPLVHHTVAQNLQDIPVACEFPDVFPEDLPGMPLDQDVEFIIELQSSTTPISRRPYKMTPKELTELKVQLNEQLNNPSSSPWGCPALFEKKKDQSLRLCVDYWPLNVITVKNKYSLSHIDILFDQPAGVRVFSKVDLRLGYHKIKIRLKMSLRLPSLPGMDCTSTWLCRLDSPNAPAHFMYLMNSLFMSELDKFVVVFIDDILIYSKSEEEHARHLRVILQQLRDHQLYAKFSKCAF
jgi:hypothetical protein